MSTILNFSSANPVRIIRTNMVGLNYNEKDNMLFHEYSKSHVRSWCQPWEQKDTIYLQFQSSFEINILELVNCITGQVVITDNDVDPALYEDGTVIEYEDLEDADFEGSDGSATEVISIESTYDVYQGRYPLQIPPGKYKFLGRGSMTDGSASYEVESEIIEVRERWYNSLLFTYYNNEPYAKIDYRSGVIMQFRIRASFIKPADESEIETIVSATSRMTKVNDVTLERREFELYEQVPDWVIRKINLILGHDYITLEDVEVVGIEKLPHGYDGYGTSWGKPSTVIAIKESDLQNRHDSGTRILFS